MKTALQSNWHTMIDARNRELHQVIAEKIRQNPALIRQVQETLERWLRAMDESERGHGSLVEWQHRLADQPLSQVLDFISSEDEEACCLRQSTPFVGLLTEQERMKVFRKYEAFRSCACPAGRRRGDAGKGVHTAPLCLMDAGMVRTSWCRVPSCGRRFATGSFAGNPRLIWFKTRQKLRTRKTKHAV